MAGQIYDRPLRYMPHPWVVAVGMKMAAMLTNVIEVRRETALKWTWDALTASAVFGTPALRVGNFAIQEDIASKTEPFMLSPLVCIAEKIHVAS